MSLREIRADIFSYRSISRMLALAGALVSSAVLGQTSEPPTAAAPSRQGAESDLGDIVVTARKRDETLISTPVIATAVRGSDLIKRGVVNLDGIARMVPQLQIASVGGNVQGGHVSIRGISGPGGNPFSDSAVAFNIDGVQVAKLSVRRMSDTDIDQVEVLKGPQALFFGKNSPAGAISIRTKDPSDKFEAGATAGYEFYAREIRGEGYVSGPVSDTLGLRLSGYASHMEGYLIDVTPSTSPYRNNHDRNPNSKDFGIRGTMKWAPSDRFSSRLKLNYSEVRNSGGTADSEYISCPLGFRQTGSNGPCGAGRRNVNAGSGPFVGTLPGTMNKFGDGHNFLHQKQILAGLEMNYEISDNVDLTSVTGYYSADMHEVQNFEQDANIILPGSVPYKDRQFSQELRLNTNYDGPLNFAAGAYFADTATETGTLLYLFGSNFALLDNLVPGLGGPTTPFMFYNFFLKQTGRSYSTYLQMIYKPFDVLEIDVGGRYSRESKKLPLVQSSSTAFLDASSNINTPTSSGNWNDFSPEVTVAYRPSGNLTIFGSYKHGFLSGGFNSGASSFAADLSYLPETIKGFEGGVKALLLGGALRANLAAYTYDVSNLQVTGYKGAVSTIRNADGVRIKGVEADFDYRTPVEGLSLHGAAAYNHGRYDKFAGTPCYVGQTPAEGCTIVDGNAVQDLSGTELIRAPKWNLSGGFNFEVPVGGSFKIGLSGDVTYSSSFLTESTSSENGRMPNYSLVDASARFGPEDGAWEVAVIGRNLTDRHYWTGLQEVPFTGSGTGTPAGVRGDLFGSVSRGREIMLRVRYSY